MPAKSLELRHTISLICELDAQTNEIEAEVQSAMKTAQSQIITITGIGLSMKAMIFAGIGDFSRFDSPDKILTCSGLSPPIYQSGWLPLNDTYFHMEKRSLHYLRYDIYNTTKFVYLWEPSFATYLAKKRDEGKLHNIAIFHASKKFARLIYAMEKSITVFHNTA